MSRQVAPKKLKAVAEVKIWEWPVVASLWLLCCVVLPCEIHKYLLEYTYNLLLWDELISM
jgi:hypothetical protein